MKTNFSSLIVELTGATALVKLNNPDSLNALSAGIKADLIEFFLEVKNEDTIRAVVLTGAGKAFCAGGDLKAEPASSPAEGRRRIKKLHELVRCIQNLEKPVIAAVNGFAVGAGMNLALACDIIIASEDAKFSEIFTNVGLIPDAGGLFFLPQLIGPMRAKELCFTARRINAEEAEHLGLVNKVVPREKLIEEAMEMAKNISRGPMVSIAYIKRLINKSAEWDLDTLLEAESFAQGICMNTRDAGEGVNAFKEKREPVFTGE
ncbi:MAG: enoyl-CoA hydratase [Spirochaetaceae bacterium]|jgi:2-(1,2-epoxy-1,2-dihydrophenyl)acetyl-CoA isomerase|nr:enoyl-CoA hydratase [Spirochaetaceae bacterium]